MVTLTFKQKIKKWSLALVLTGRQRNLWGPFHRISTVCPLLQRLKREEKKTNKILLLDIYFQCINFL